MPFTLAHPAAVIPIYRMARFLSLPALVIGSLSPDFPYFTASGLSHLHTHNGLAILWFCLPASLLMYLLYFSILAPVLPELSPATFHRRWAMSMSSNQWHRAPWVTVVISSLIGAATHIVWDSFTHADGAWVLALPLLQTTITTAGGYTIYVFKLMQHGSTIIGMGLLLIWMFRRPSQFESSCFVSPRLSPICRIGLVAIMSIVPLFVGTAAGLHHIHGELWLRQIQQFSGNFALSAGSALLMCWTLIGIVYRIYFNRRKEDGVNCSP